MNEKKLLMTEGTIWKVLVRFAFPLFLGGLFQQLYNAVDSWVVGKYCGDAALAAVSSSGSLCFLLIGFFQGVFLGGGVIISRFYGARDKEGVDKAIHTLVAFSLILGVVLSILGVIFTPELLRWMGTPNEVINNSITYFRIYCSGMMALILYNTANGIFQALGDSKHPLYYLAIASLANVVLDFVFVAGFDWGVGGAALATVLGQMISAIIAFAHLMSGKFVVKVELKNLAFNRDILKDVFMQGLPSGVQNSVIAIANVVVQSNINAFGDLAMAGCGSYSKVEGFVFLPIMSLTMAITTFVSQNLGAGNIERARDGARKGTILAIIFAELIGIVFFIFAPQLIGLFSDTPAVIEYGVSQARVISLFYCVLSLAHCSASILRGAGKAMIPMIIMLSVWCVFRILYITVMVKFIPNIIVVYTAYPVTWMISCILFIYLLKHHNWIENN